MEHRSVIALSARDGPYRVIVEPWADEFQIEPGVRCQLVALHPHLFPSFEVELYQGVLIVYVNEGESTYEFYRGLVRES